MFAVLRKNSTIVQCSNIGIVYNMKEWHGWWVVCRQTLRQAVAQLELELPRPCQFFAFVTPPSPHLTSPQSWWKFSKYFDFFKGKNSFFQSCSEWCQKLKKNISHNVFFYFDSFPNSNKNLLKRSTDTFRISTESKVNYLFKGRDHELYSTLKGRGQKPQLS